MSDLIQQGIEKKLIEFDEEQKYITYLHQGKRRNYQNPEEKVQAETFLKLVLVYNYPAEHIRQFVSVQMGSETKEADIIVYNDAEYKSPHIVVECKKQEISELEFKTAVDQGFSYAVAEGAKYVWTTSGIKDEYYEVPIIKPKDRINIPDIPFYGSKEILEYKYVRNGKRDGKHYFDIETVSEDDLTRVFKQAHNALWAGGELNPSEAFDELDKLIFCKIWDERNTKRGEPYKFQVIIAKDKEGNDITNEALLARIKELYEEGRKKDPEVFKDGIRLNPSKVRTVVGYLEKINLNKTDLDSKGRAFETFMGSFFRGDFGQYFTPRPIVKFIVDTLPITKDSFVLDTSCGSGGFLLHALDKVRREADKAFMNDEGEIDKDDINDHHKYWHDFAEKNLYGIEINEQIARVAKMNMIIHDDGHTNVISTDGLNPIDTIASINDRFKFDHFDFIITNPPFGSTIKQTEKAYLNQYGFGMKETNWLDLKSTEDKKRDNQSTEVLFIEQAHRFLKEGGYLAVVIPDGILTNSSLQYVRDGIEDMYRIVAVVSMPQTAFSATGAGVKSSVLFLKKYSAKQSARIKLLKESLKDDTKKSLGYEKEVRKLEETKKQQIKALDARKLDKKSDEYKEARDEINKAYAEALETLKETAIDTYKQSKAAKLAEIDYEIFMAIAEDIGYDATGKPTGNNELEYIGAELSRFIAQVERE
ncbi:MAG: N-6 DNA methylase [Sulfuricurvum sp.]|jgi:type I restriction enzyme M protein|nr:N-6 DNA methylase [Sulfuricurvum sp.]